MNERIKSLAEQCHHQYSEYNIDLEKFAELIVRECAGICEWQYSHKHKDMSEGACAAMACSDAILEHFGVE